MSDLFDLSGKVALITGATRGIGLAIARGMGRQGARVVVASEDETDCASVAATLRGEGIDATGLACDVTDDAAIAALVADSVARCGGIDIMVSNAGITGKPGAIATMDMADYDHVMALNLRSMVVLSQQALPHLAAGGGGAAVLMASIAGLRGNGAISAYAMAKAGVAQLARNLAVEWGPRNVRVNAISPGLIHTPLSEPLMANQSFMQRRMGMTPLRRLGLPEEVAGAAIFLSSPAGAFVTGHNLVVDGGTVITDGS